MLPDPRDDTRRGDSGPDPDLTPRSDPVACGPAPWTPIAPYGVLPAIRSGDRDTSIRSGDRDTAMARIKVNVKSRVKVRVTPKVRVRVRVRADGRDGALATVKASASARTTTSYRDRT